LNCTIFRLNSAFWLDCALKLYYVSCQSEQLMSFWQKSNSSSTSTGRNVRLSNLQNIHVHCPNYRVSVIEIRNRRTTPAARLWWRLMMHLYHVRQMEMQSQCHVDRLRLRSQNITIYLILIENLVKTTHKLNTWCCQRDYVHLSLVVIYILTASFGFNVSQLVILDCVSARMFTKKTLHILGIVFCLRRIVGRKSCQTWKFAERFINRYWLFGYILVVVYDCLLELSKA